MCEQLLANPLIESYEIELGAMRASPAPDRRPRLPRLERRPRRAARARAARRRAVPVWHADARLPDVGAVVLPGGFSYGDYLRCGAIARFAPAMEAVRAVRRGRRPRARDLQRLPGALRGRPAARASCAATRRSSSSAATSRPASSRPTRRSRPAATPGRRSRSRSSTARAAWFADDELLDERRAERPGRAALRGGNPNGSRADVAGVVNERRNVIGPDAAPGARGRPAARLDRRRAAARSLVDAARERRPASPAALQPERARRAPGAWRGPSRSRSRSRARSVTGPRRAVPPVV